MNIRIASTLAWSVPVEEVIRLAIKFHLAGVEVWAEHVWKYESNVKQIQQVKKEANIELTMHAASWDLNLCSINTGIRKQSILEIVRSIELASRIGADNITFHPGKRTIVDSDVSFHEALLFESMVELDRKARQEGIILSLEMMEWREKEFITNPIAVKKVIDPFPQIQSTFDVAHIPLHENIFSIWNDMPEVNKIHISDATQEILHLPLGEGKIDEEILLQFLSIENIPVVIEGFDYSKEFTMLKKNMEFLQKYSNRLKEVVV